MDGFQNETSRYTYRPRITTHINHETSAVGTGVFSTAIPPQQMNTSTVHNTATAVQTVRENTNQVLENNINRNVVQRNAASTVSQSTQNQTVRARDWGTYFPAVAKDAHSFLEEHEAQIVSPEIKAGIQEFQLYKHIVVPTLQRGEVSGGHMRIARYVNMVKGLSYENQSGTDRHGVYEIDVKIGAISDRKTMFPETMSVWDVFRSADEAFQNREFKDSTNLSWTPTSYIPRSKAYVGTCANGMKIRFYVERGIVTAFYPIMGRVVMNNEAGDNG